MMPDPAWYYWPADRESCLGTVSLLTERAVLVLLDCWQRELSPAWHYSPAYRESSLQLGTIGLMTERAVSYFHLQEISAEVCVEFFLLEVAAFYLCWWSFYNFIWSKLDFLFGCYNLFRYFVLLFSAVGVFASARYIVHLLRWIQFFL